MRHLTLFLPGLLGPAAEITRALLREGSLPALRILLARSDRWRPKGPDPCDYEAELCNLFGIEGEAGELPIAAIARLAEAEIEPAEVWMRADPVFLRPDLGKLLLFDAGSLGLDRSEAAALIEELQPLVTNRGLRLVIGARPYHWYLQLRRTPAIRTRPPSAARGRHIDPFLPAGPDQLYWNRLGNEIQMALHATRINRAREARAAAPINSLWFWGAGALPAAPPVRWGGVFSRDPLACGLARFTGAPRCDPPDDAATLFARFESMDCALVVLDPGEGCSRSVDPETWRQHLIAVEQAWFAPLVLLLKRGRLRRLAVQSDGRRYTITRKAIWRVWRKPKPGSLD